eukprot:CAMPEP_0114490640 /NCGR_PEP_ID=MMETSP0109-20121206/2554_1 /TAXON_ID=29199 /ORGANISM="Chlorarachnion reptans, Strain CCCM449" /LENGTH=626 /DNA_ID=CAMNT_0001667279 /DNA_START=404 /DNA_END=2284 /DNA_ORIENTATION=-
MCVNLVGTEYWLPVAYPFEPQLMDEGLFTWTDDRWWLAGTGDSAKEVFQNYNKAKSLSIVAEQYLHTCAFPVLCVATLVAGRQRGSRSAGFLFLRSMLSASTLCAALYTSSYIIPEIFGDRASLSLQSSGGGGGGSPARSRSSSSSNNNSSADDTKKRARGDGDEGSAARNAQLQGLKMVNPGIAAVIFCMLDLPLASAFCAVHCALYGFLIRGRYEKWMPVRTESIQLDLKTNLRVVRHLAAAEMTFLYEWLISPMATVLKGAKDRSSVFWYERTLYEGYTRRVMSLGRDRCSLILEDPVLRRAISSQIGGGLVDDLPRLSEGARRNSHEAREGVLELMCYWRKYNQKPATEARQQDISGRHGAPESASPGETIQGTDVRLWFPVVSRETGKRALLLIEGEIVSSDNTKELKAITRFLDNYIDTCERRRNRHRRKRDSSKKPDSKGKGVLHRERNAVAKFPSKNIDRKLTPPPRVGHNNEVVINIKRQPFPAGMDLSSIGDDALILVSTKDGNPESASSRTRAHTVGARGTELKISRAGICRWDPLKPYPRPLIEDGEEILREALKGERKMPRVPTMPRFRLTHARREIKFAKSQPEVSWMQISDRDNAEESCHIINLDVSSRKQ